MLWAAQGVEARGVSYLRGRTPSKEIRMASHPASYQPPVETDSGAFFKVATILLGLAVGVVGFFAFSMWTDSRESRGAAPAAATEITPPRTTTPLCRCQLRRRRAGERDPAGRCTQALRRGAACGPGRRSRQGAHDPEGHDCRDRAWRQVHTWAFDGHGAPGPVVHVREGQTVEMTLRTAARSRIRSTFTRPALRRTSRSWT